MAESPSHRFGQAVGVLLEDMLKPELLRFCDERGLYLDRHGARIGVRGGRKVSWEDRYGNSHDLDFVIEKDGSETRRGRPVAFIEAAWRRYTKHSRAKAQEIQGAVLPIAEKYELEAPFLGAVLAGVFTSPALDQLRSMGFNVVYLPYESVIAAFAGVGIDARFDEATSDADFRQCADSIEALSANERAQVRAAMLSSNTAQFEQFFTRLRRKLDRIVERVAILPLFGTPATFANATEAAAFVSAFDPAAATGSFRKYEVSIMFSNTDTVRGTFREPDEAIRFLRYVTA